MRDRLRHARETAGLHVDLGDLRREGRPEGAAVEVVLRLVERLRGLFDLRFERPDLHLLGVDLGERVGHRFDDRVAHALPALIGAIESLLPARDIVAQAHEIAPNTPCLSASTPVRDALATIDPPNNEPDFGAQLLVANFDDGDVPDLVVSAPSTRSVYIYFNLDLDAGPAGTPVTITLDGSVRFGEALAVGDFDGDAKHELVVGDPNVVVNGTANAGSAHIYTFSGQTPTLAATLHDVSPTSDQRFGRNLGVAQFGGAQDILIVAAKDEVFTYFRNPVSMGDVRSGL